LERERTDARRPSWQWRPLEVSLDTNELSLHFKAATRSQPPPPPPEDGEEPVDLSGSLGSLR